MNNEILRNRILEAAILGQASTKLLQLMRENAYEGYTTFREMADPKELPTAGQQMEINRQVLKRAFREQCGLFWRVLDEVPEIINYLNLEEDLGLPRGFELGEDIP